MANSNLNSEARIVTLNPGDRIVTPDLDRFHREGNYAVNRIMQAVGRVVSRGEVGHNGQPNASHIRSIMAVTVQFKDAVLDTRTQGHLDHFDGLILDDGLVPGSMMGPWLRDLLVKPEGKSLTVETNLRKYGLLRADEITVSDLLCLTWQDKPSNRSKYEIVGRHRLAPCMHAKDFRKHLRLP